MTPEELKFVAEKSRLWTGPYSWGAIVGYRFDLRTVLQIPWESRQGFT